MLFIELQEALLAHVRRKVRNGEMTERALAKQVGVSQPHMHNVLKTHRSITPQLSDRMLHILRLTVLDLMEESHVKEHLKKIVPGTDHYSHVPVLEGLLGPDHPWPSRLKPNDSLPVPTSTLRSIAHPVIVKFAADSRMSPTFGSGDTALLNQSRRARTEIDSEAYYVVRRGYSGMVRKARLSGRHLFLIAEDCLASPGGWEKIDLHSWTLEHIIRAKVIFLTGDREWVT